MAKGLGGGGANADVRPRTSVGSGRCRADLSDRSRRDAPADGDADGDVHDDADDSANADVDLDDSA